MGKRTAFERFDRDLYETPPQPMAMLLPHLARGASFAEPCAGAGKMVDYFESAGHPCVFACDIHPLRPDITALPAASLRYVKADLFITNPPWAWDMLLPIITNLIWQKPTWLLLWADMMHNQRSAPLLESCAKIVPVGRVQWIPGSKHKGGYDNAAWYFWEPGHKGGPRFVPRRRSGE